ncbi:hypothetical protein [Trichocoleus sp. FACHB-262]|uniref:hypothetical protein n=1 Tax=Trichocoleus sp. FACHB-262 TaxID=2692869 RepID=UPI001682E1CB|nr:hypothetical protein [Trichocoleus sp. FACHB-262]MBD2122887.1 hypothetical protein [Trichocoleus sp. FACHB-262]
MSILEFEPYKLYYNNKKNLRDFYKLTELSYALDDCILKENSILNIPKGLLGDFLTKPVSYSMESSYRLEQEEEWGWFTLREYAEKFNKTLSAIEHEIQEELIQRVGFHPETEERYILYLGSLQNLHSSLLENIIPPVGEKKTSTLSSHPLQSEILKVAIEHYNLTEETASQKIGYALLAYSYLINKQNCLTTFLMENLNQQCFLLNWTLFEDFIKKTIYELVRRHPEVIPILNSSGKLTYQELFEETKSFTSINDLVENIVRREILRIESGGESISSLIDFLKKYFSFTNDPYRATYVIEGISQSASHQDLEEIGKARNAIIHQQGYVSSDFFGVYPNIPRRENKILITSQFYLKTDLLLSSIAFSMANDISKKDYRLRQGNKAKRNSNS